jgi:hypothetical protein
MLRERDLTADPEALTRGGVGALRETLRDVSTTVVSIIGLCYALGLLIVNLHLAMYGMFSFGFAQTQYVLAGALLVFLLTFVRVSYYYGATGVTEGIAEVREGAVLLGLFKIVFFVVAAAFFPVALIHFLAGYGAVVSTSWPPWAFLGVLGMMAFVLNAAQNQVIFVWRDFRRAEFAQLPPSARKSLLFRVLQPVPPLLAVLFVYSLLCYPMVYPAFGGGRHDVIFVIPTAEGARICRTAKLPANVNGSVFGPLEVVVETSDETVIKAPKQLLNIRAVRLRRDLFQAVLNRRGT